ncbi:MAG TPA: glycoside hydrolase family 5 protein, partial [Kofleriaceae bacterium]
RVTLHGADRAGTEYACVNGNGTFDGPHDQASIDAMKSWHLNAVRVPLNEDCWLGINGVNVPTYRDDIRAYVTLLEQNQMYVILDLHWAAPGTEKADGQLGMADADHAPTFWTEVATAYKGDHERVIFDLFNEPFITDWECWANGGACAVDYNNATYTVAGMSQLVKAVRDAGADNLVMMGGLSYSADFAMWLAKVPNDSNVAVSWHTYSDQSVQTICPTQYNGYNPQLTCVDGATTAANYGIPPLLAAGYPVVVGEIGIGVYSNQIAPYTVTQAGHLTTWLESMLVYFDAHDISYLGWDWNTEAAPLLVTDFAGTPSPYFGVTFKAHPR